MTFVTVFGVGNYFSLGNRHIFACEVDFVHKEFSLYDDGVTRNFVIGLVKVSWDNVDVVNLGIVSIAQYFDLE